MADTDESDAESEKREPPEKRTPRPLDRLPHLDMDHTPERVAVLAQLCRNFEELTGAIDDFDPYHFVYHSLLRNNHPDSVILAITGIIKAVDMFDEFWKVGGSLLQNRSGMFSEEDHISEGGVTKKVWLELLADEEIVVPDYVDKPRKLLIPSPPDESINPYDFKPDTQSSTSEKIIKIAEQCQEFEKVTGGTTDLDPYQFVSYALGQNYHPDLVEYALIRLIPMRGIDDLQRRGETIMWKRVGYFPVMERTRKAEEAKKLWLEILEHITQTSDGTDDFSKVRFDLVVEEIKQKASEASQKTDKPAEETKKKKKNVPRPLNRIPDFDLNNVPDRVINLLQLCQEFEKETGAADEFDPYHFVYHALFRDKHPDSIIQALNGIVKTLNLFDEYWKVGESILENRSGVYSEEHYGNDDGETKRVWLELLAHEDVIIPDYVDKPRKLLTEPVPETEAFELYPLPEQRICLPPETKDLNEDQSSLQRCRLPLLDPKIVTQKVVNLAFLCQEFERLTEGTNELDPYELVSHALSNEHHPDLVEYTLRRIIPMRKIDGLWRKAEMIMWKRLGGFPKEERSKEAKKVMTIWANLLEYGTYPPEAPGKKSQKSEKKSPALKNKAKEPRPLDRLPRFVPEIMPRPVKRLVALCRKFEEQTDATSYFDPYHFVHYALTNGHHPDTIDYALEEINERWHEMTHLWWAGRSLLEGQIELYSSKEHAKEDGRTRDIWVKLMENEEIVIPDDIEEVCKLFSRPSQDNDLLIQRTPLSERARHRFPLLHEDSGYSIMIFRLTDMCWEFEEVTKGDIDFDPYKFVCEGFKQDLHPEAIEYALQDLVNIRDTIEDFWRIGMLTMRAKANLYYKDEQIKEAKRIKKEWMKFILKTGMW